MPQKNKGHFLMYGYGLDCSNGSYSNTFNH